MCWVRVSGCNCYLGNALIGPASIWGGLPLGKLFYLWWPIWVGHLSLWLDTWEAPRRPHYTDPDARPSFPQQASQTSFYVCTSYWTPSGWLSSEAHFACQSNRGFGFPLRTWTGTHHFCWNLFCQDFNPDMAWCDSFGYFRSILTFLKLNWCDSSWWRYKLNTNW